jgi:hypothetical protein
MTPQEKQVFSKLFPKTELGTHKVDLALVDDVRNQIDNTFKFGTELETLYNVELDNVKKKILKQYNSLLNEIPKADKAYQDLKRKSLDLGLEFPKNLEALYMEMIKMAKEEQQRINSIK